MRYLRWCGLGMLDGWMGVVGFIQCEGSEGGEAVRCRGGGGGWRVEDCWVGVSWGDCWGIGKGGGGRKGWGGLC